MQWQPLICTMMAACLAAFACLTAASPTARAFGACIPSARSAIQLRTSLRTSLHHGANILHLIQAHDAQLLLCLPQQPDLPGPVARVPVSAQYGNNAAAQLQLQPKSRWEQPISSCHREHHAHATVWTLDGCQMQAQAAVDSRAVKMSCGIWRAPDLLVHDEAIGRAIALPPLLVPLHTLLQVGGRLRAELPRLLLLLLLSLVPALLLPLQARRPILCDTSRASSTSSEKTSKQASKQT